MYITIMITVIGKNFFTKIYNLKFYNLNVFVSRPALTLYPRVLK